MSGDSDRIRVLCVDDHAVVRQGIVGLISVQADMVLVGEAGDGREAIQQFRAHRPHVTLMDMQMPVMNGLDAIIAIRGEFPDACIIVLTTYPSDTQALRALKAGACTYLLKNAMHKELLDAIRDVHAGRKALTAAGTELTPAEIRILRLIAHGNANREIARELSVSEEVVEGQVCTILSKLEAKDPTQAAMVGFKRGIIEF